MSTKPKIAIVGAGLMGHGIAAVFAIAGHDVARGARQRQMPDVNRVEGAAQDARAGHSHAISVSPMRMRSPGCTFTRCSARPT